MSPDPSTVCWVASYPKSGNTWVRFLISALLQDEPVSAADVEVLIPDVHELGRRGNVQIYNPVHQTCYIKTHWMFDTERQVFASSNRCVYILRNPMDVLASHLNFIQFKNENSRGVFIQAFIEQGGAPMWFDHLMGSWRDNCLSWINGPEKKLVLIYEDFIADPFLQLSKLADFIGVDVDSERLEDIARANDFTAMQNQEEQAKSSGDESIFRAFSESRPDASSFMYKGRANYFSEILTEETVALGLETFAPHIRVIENTLERELRCWDFFND